MCFTFSSATAKHYIKIFSERNEASKTEGHAFKLDDILIVSKAPEVEDKIKSKVVDCPELVDTNEVIEDYETVVKRKLQKLQALQAKDRGRLALIDEIAEIKKLRDRQSEALKRRQKALEIEKERSKKIASLPPPLPHSIKSLLKEKDKKNCECKEMNEKQESEQPFIGLQGTAFGTSKEYDLAYDFENKENILSISEKIERERLQELAMKRYNEALKKDRVRQECEETLKQIENAELANRRLLAKSIASKGGTVPCSVPDKLMNSEKQVQMEDAVETLYKNNPKEHAIEDLEGYKDQWEEKYKKVDSISAKVDSTYTHRMSDCVPKYVKENYSYLMEDESIYRCGNRFSRLEESFDQLNVAYIESPPSNHANDRKLSSTELEEVINELDKMRAETDEVYEKEFKPLLERSLSQNKPDAADKAVEVLTLRQPTEDKSIQNCRLPLHEELTSVSVQVDLPRGGIMDFQRRNIGSRLMSHETDSNKYANDYGYSHSKQTPLESHQLSSNSENWSSTSYFSLPSNHGLPILPEDPTSYVTTSAKVLTAPRDCIPLAKAPKELGTNSAGESDRVPRRKEKSPTKKLEQTLDSKRVEKQSHNVPPIHDESLRQSQLSYYLKKVAEKHSLYPSTSQAVDIVKMTSKKDHQHAVYQERIKEAESTDSSPVLSPEKIPNVNVQTIPETSDLLSQYNYQEINKVPVTISWDGVPFQRDESSLNSLEESCLSTQDIATNNVVEDKKPRDLHKFHDLSTIAEMDSVFTNDTVPSYINLSKSSSYKEPDMNTAGRLQDRKGLNDVSISPASLLDPPPSQISELAKSIKFVDDTSGSKVRDSLPLFSGTLGDFRTPTSNIRASTPHLPPPSRSADRELHEHRTVLTESNVSSLSAASQRTPYSSSFQDSYRRPPYLTDVETLPKYFEDISSVAQGNRFIKYHGGFERTPFLSNYSDTPSVPLGGARDQEKSTPNELVLKQMPLPDSSGGSFKAVSACSYPSSLSPSPQSGSTDKAGVSLDKHSGSFKADSPHYDVSSSSPFSEIRYDSGGPKEKSPLEYSKAVTPHSYASSLNHSPRTGISDRPFEKSPQKKSMLSNMQEELSDSSSTLKPQTPLFYSSSEKSSLSQARAAQRHFSESSMQSKRKTPLGWQTEDDSAGSFTNDRPRSYTLSTTTSQTPGSIRGEGYMDKNTQNWYYAEESEGSVKSPENVRADSLNTRISSPVLEQTISFHSLHSEDSSASSKSSISKYSKTHYKDSRKTPVPTDTKYQFSDKNLPSSPEHLQYNFSVGDGFHREQNQMIASTTALELSKPKKYGSDIFVPQLDEHNKSPQSEDFVAQLKPCNLLESEDTQSAKFVPNSNCDTELFDRDKESMNRVFKNRDGNGCSNTVSPQLGKINLPLDATRNKEGSKIKGSPSQSVEFNKNKPETLVVTLKEKCYYPTRNDPRAADRIKQNLESKILKNIMQHHFVPVSSASVTTPTHASASNSSLFFGTQINYQPTPSKTIEEIIEETGILDESDLTLIKSEMTLKPESPEKEQLSKLGYNHKQGALESVKEHPDAFTEQLNAYASPEAAAFQSPAYCESPSLLSFMRHELSCLSDDTSEASPNPKTEKAASKIPRSVEKKGKLTSKKTPGKDYRARTKRLYNNLEEVKSRRALEERRDQMMKNRLKMKAYSKKFAPNK